MEDLNSCGVPDYFKDCDSLVDFVSQFAAIDADDKLFPKTCRTCGRSYCNFAEYVAATSPKGHCLEDCQEVMGQPFTMMYRHCKCGNTLVISLTSETFPRLDEFWAMLRKQADTLGIPLREIVKSFATRCEEHIVGPTSVTCE